MLDVVTFGEAMAMFVAEETGELHQVKRFMLRLAGAETNVAVGLARLGLGVGWVSKVGNDPFGQYIRESLTKENVDISKVVMDPDYPTGFQLKSKVTSSDPEVVYFRKGSAASRLEPADLSDSYFTSASHLHLTGIPPALSSTMRAVSEHVLVLMREHGRTISFDPNLRPSLWKNEAEMVGEINRLAIRADWVLPGIAEGEILTGYSKPRDIAAFYLDKGVKLVVIKLGAKGAYYRTATEEGEVPGFPVKQVVDTVGAGDGFAAGVISGLLERLPISQAVLRANAIGALAVMTQGDQDGLPTREQLESFMSASLYHAK
jgi:2-dehydro-3-deoxygluconokinase